MKMKLEWTGKLTTHMKIDLEGLCREFDDVWLLPRKKVRITIEEL